MTGRDFSNSIILVTGGAGFIGSNFIYYITELYPDAAVINFDKLTYAGNIENLDGVKAHKHYRFIRGDISSKKDVENLFDKFDIDCIINFAAESHVDRSIIDVGPFIDTNIGGTANLMGIARTRWANNLGNKLFIHISTDEVYGALGKTGKFTENTPLAPRNPYSSSKAAADMMALSFVNTYNFPVVITRCSNNYGKYQFPEKLIPLTIINILNNRDIPIYGDGMQIRDWIYVDDHCEGIEIAMRKGRIGEVYNFGGESEIYNIDLVGKICRLCDEAGVSSNSARLIKHVTDRPGHDRHYAMDIGKVSKDLGWSPKYKLDDALKETVNWYLKNKTWWTKLLNREYKDYYEKQYGDR